MDKYVALWKSSQGHNSEWIGGKRKREASKKDFQKEVINELNIKISEG